MYVVYLQRYFLIIGQFGVSGQLSKSLAKTYIGCQSYMAPERIQNTNCGAYTIAADVYSLGICLWETAMGKYPFPPEKYDSLFAQLCAIVSEQLPPLNSRFSNECQTIILSMLTRNPEERPSYSQLLDSSFIRLNSAKDEEIREWARI
jgi:mitogen-activated protein kinase kinase